MLPTINGKSFLECDYSDLQLLIDNTDYRENQYIDYKKVFAFNEVKDKHLKEGKKAEFRNDICSFANAEGGYLIFGISDDKGCASEITGIPIPKNDTDNFELMIRNTLNGIYPRKPNVQIRFVTISDNNYVVIIYIKRDSFAPYTHIENERNYKFYKRTGNGKSIIPYVELRNMFNQSLSLDNEILLYRKKRIKYYNDQSETENDSYSKFMLFYIIPDTFLDHEYNQDMFILQKRKGLKFSSVFSEFHCNYNSIPCVNGIRFIPDSEYNNKAECYIYNNCIIECFYSLNKLLSKRPQRYPKGCIPRTYLWKMIKTTYNNVLEFKNELFKCDRVFLCLDIVGCKGVTSQDPNEDFLAYYTGTIDRNTLICEPVVISDVNNNAILENTIKKLELNYLLSIGVKFGKDLDSLIKELYPQ